MKDPNYAARFSANQSTTATGRIQDVSLRMALQQYRRLQGNQQNESTHNEAEASRLP